MFAKTEFTFDNTFRVFLEEVFAFVHENAAEECSPRKWIRHGFNGRCGWKMVRELLPFELLRRDGSSRDNSVGRIAKPEKEDATIARKIRDQQFKVVDAMLESVRKAEHTSVESRDRASRLTEWTFVVKIVNELNAAIIALVVIGFLNAGAKGKRSMGIGDMRKSFCHKRRDKRGV